MESSSGRRSDAKRAEGRLARDLRYASGFGALISSGSGVAEELGLKAVATVCMGLGASAMLYMIARVLPIAARMTIRTAAGIRERRAQAAAMTKEAPATAGKSLAGNGRISRFAVLLLPRDEREDWLHDLSESTYYANEFDAKVLSTLLGHVIAFPWVVVTYWLRAFRATSVVAKPMDTDLRQAMERCALAAAALFPTLKVVASRLWREWKVALVLAILAAVLMEPLWHIATYELHEAGRVWPWELYFPLH